MEPVNYSFEPSEIGEIILKQLKKLQKTAEYITDKIDMTIDRVWWIVYGPESSSPSLEEFELLVPILFDEYNCSKFIASWSNTKLAKN